MALRHERDGFTSWCNHRRVMALHHGRCSRGVFHIWGKFLLVFIHEYEDGFASPDGFTRILKQDVDTEPQIGK